jgi:hypothetical protein
MAATDAAPSLTVLLTHALDALGEARGLVRGAEQALAARRPTSVFMPWARRPKEVAAGQRVMYSGDALDRARDHLRAARAAAVGVWAHADHAEVDDLRDVLDAATLDRAIAALQLDAVPAKPLEAAAHLTAVLGDLGSAEQRLQRAVTLRAMRGR